MGKLYIDKIERTPAHDWYIRFVGKYDDFQDMKQDLQMERQVAGWEVCHWEPAAFDGLGGWHLATYLMEHYADRFINLQQRMNAVRVKQREQVVPSSYDDVPF